MMPVKLDISQYLRHQHAQEPTEPMVLRQIQDRQKNWKISLFPLAYLKHHFARS